MRSLFFFVLILCMFASGCGAPKIDASTDENMKDSIAKVRSSLPDEKKEEFDEALAILAFDQVEFTDFIQEEATGVGTTEAKMKNAIGGKTGEEVIAAAQEILRLREEKEKEQAMLEIKELQEKRDLAEKNKKELAKFEISKSRFYKQEQEFMGDEPIIELTVKNGTKYPISRAYFVGTIASPGRSIPWLKKDFNYEIPGGLEPGEEASWRLAPNMFSEWGTVEVPKDAIFTVETERLDGVNGESLFDASIFDDDDLERLNELINKYPNE